MNDDFNAPRAIAALFDLSREVNTLLNSGQAASHGTLEAAGALFQRLAGDALGLRLSEATAGASTGERELLDGVVRLLIEMRREARAARDWARADAIRNRLAELGIALEDGPEGTRWRLSR